MKHWAVLTVLLYVLALFILTLPLALAAFGNWGKNESHYGLHDTFDHFYLNWSYWLWLAVVGGGQFLLLLLPVNIAERRLPARRTLKIPVMVTAFFLANLVFAGLLSIFCALFKEEGFGLFGFLTPFTKHQLSPSNLEAETGIVITVLVFWFIWAVVFQRFAKSDDPDALLKRVMHWLLRGSILELLVAVPCHIIVRRRGDCCAPFGTFWGIATGISVMLLCFGPGVFFLFVERCRKLKPKPMNTDKNLK